MKCSGERIDLIVLTTERKIPQLFYQRMIPMSPKEGEIACLDLRGKWGRAHHL